LLSAPQWEEVLIVSKVEMAPIPSLAGTMAAALPADALVAATNIAPGQKCDRCWRVLPEVGASAAHPTLCRRCEAVVERAA
jgi:isoleucyl-tRNA synthetase